MSRDSEVADLCDAFLSRPAFQKPALFEWLTWPLAAYGFGSAGLLELAVIALMLMILVGFWIEHRSAIHYVTEIRDTVTGWDR
jgi:hypothetical protein